VEDDKQFSRGRLNYVEQKFGASVESIKIKVSYIMIILIV